MVAMVVIPDGTVERSGADFDPNKVLHVQETVSLIGMPRGTASGRPTVIIRAKLPDGREVFIETTLRLLHSAVSVLWSKYEG